MWPLINFLSKNLSYLIVLVAIGTYFSPVYMQVSSWLPSLLLGIVIFFAGLTMNISAFQNIRTKKRELFLATLLKWTLTVFISIGLAYGLFLGTPEIAAGLILSGTVPSATAAAVYTFLAGGNTSLVIAASLLDVGISPIVTPLAMLGFPNNEVSISFFQLLESFLLIVVLPLSIGLGMQRFFPGTVTYSKAITRLGTSVSLLLIVHTIVGNGKEAISSEISLLPTIAIATIIQVVLPMACAYFICKKLGITEQDARATLFQVGLCNSALATILAFQFIGELGVVAPILNMIFNLSIGAMIAEYFSYKN